MADINIRTEGKVGRITLNRPEALNALTYEMCLAIEDALDNWADDDTVAMILIDAAGDKAFCAGGDIQEMYDTARAGNYEYGRKFWADEYRLNAKIVNYPKPYVALMQGFTMGGGVGVSCHGSHRIVCETSKISMPECSIGLVPDVGGSLLLARAPGHIGDYLGVTGFRMNAGGAIFAGFADSFVPQEKWPAMIDELVATGDPEIIAGFTAEPPVSTMQQDRNYIDHYFKSGNLWGIITALRSERSEENAYALIAIGKNSPLSMACTLEMLKNLRACDGDIYEALSKEYRFTYRSASDGDFVEGIRAAIIDKDRNPKWKIDRPELVRDSDIAKMLAPLGANELKLKETS